jgi:hypothetical protein
MIFYMCIMFVSAFVVGVLGIILIIKKGGSAW